MYPEHQARNSGSGRFDWHCHSVACTRLTRLDLLQAVTRFRKRKWTAKGKEGTRVVEVWFYPVSYMDVNRLILQDTSIGAVSGYTTPQSKPCLGSSLCLLARQTMKERVHLNYWLEGWPIQCGRGWGGTKWEEPPFCDVLETCRSNHRAWGSLIGHD